MWRQHRAHPPPGSGPAGEAEPELTGPDPYLRAVRDLLSRVPHGPIAIWR